MPTYFRQPPTIDFLPPRAARPSRAMSTATWRGRGLEWPRSRLSGRMVIIFFLVTHDTIQSSGTMLPLTTKHSRASDGFSLVKFDRQRYPDAVCLDGTAGGFYHRPGSVADAVVVHMEGVRGRVTSSPPRPVPAPGTTPPLPSPPFPSLPHATCTAAHSPPMEPNTATTATTPTTPTTPPTPLMGIVS